MKTVYLSRSFQQVVVNAAVPGDIYTDFATGDCRRLTARRLCLAAERLGRESGALLGLLAAIGEAAVDGEYDGRAVTDWYGLLGLPAPAPEPDQLIPVRCPRCRARHLVLREAGKLFAGGLCGACWARSDLVAV